MSDTVAITCVHLGWVTGADDDPHDHCAHSPVSLVAGGTELLAPADGTWTVSASALYLLRALDEDHRETARVSGASQLFPCCAFGGIVQSGAHPTVFFGCPSGVDLWIVHEGDRVTLESERGRAVVSQREWRAAVLRFVDSVCAFYARSQVKVTPIDADDASVWESFWQELNDRRSRAGST